MADSAVLVETTILVDYLRGSRGAADFLDAARAEGELFSSAVTKAELIVGSRTRATFSRVACSTPFGVPRRHFDHYRRRDRGKQVRQQAGEQMFAATWSSKNKPSFAFRPS